MTKAVLKLTEGRLWTPQPRDHSGTSQLIPDQLRREVGSGRAGLGTGVADSSTSEPRCAGLGQIVVQEAAQQEAGLR